jgi:hypothetical protein
MRKYFLDLGFFPSYDDLDLGTSVIHQRMVWSLVVYVMTTLGIFCRQYTDFPRIVTHLDRIEGPVILGSFVIGLALLPLPMYWFNRGKKRGSKPDWKQVILAFSFGFFVDLSGQKLADMIFGLIKSGGAHL